MNETFNPVQLSEAARAYVEFEAERCDVAEADVIAFAIGLLAHARRQLSCHPAVLIAADSELDSAQQLGMTSAPIGESALAQPVGTVLPAFRLRVGDSDVPSLRLVDPLPEA